MDINEKRKNTLESYSLRATDTMNHSQNLAFLKSIDPSGSLDEITKLKIILTFRDDLNTLYSEKMATIINQLGMTEEVKVIFESPKFEAEFMAGLKKSVAEAKKEEVE